MKPIWKNQERMAINANYNDAHMNHEQHTWWLRLGVESPSSPYNILCKLWWELNNVVIYMFSPGPRLIANYLP
jgi:hypothetical protein